MIVCKFNCMNMFKFFAFSELECNRYGGKQKGNITD
jgi:hypothetical protein